MRASTIALIAEDEILVLLDIEDALKKVGINQLISFATSALALQWLETHTADIAVIDYRLIDGTSEEIATALRAKNVPTVVFSGNDFPTDEHHAFKDVVWVRKPASIEALEKAIVSAIAPAELGE